MNIKYSDPMPPESRKVILSKGGSCHRMPLVAPMPVQGPLGIPDIVVISGFGVCQMDICPLWDGSKEECSEAHPSHAQRIEDAKADMEADAAKAAEVADEGAGEEPRRIVTP